MRIYISTPKGCPENWRSNHRDRSMFPSFQSIPWGYTALQVWAPSFHSVIQAYYCPPIHPYFEWHITLLTYKQTSTVPPSMQALYSNTPIPTIYYYNTTPYPAVPSRGLDLNQKARLAGKFSLWSLEMSGTQPPDQLYFYKYTSSKSHWFNTIDLTTTGQRIPWTYSLIKYTSVTEKPEES